MFIPIGDTPNAKETPWLTWALIAVNVAVFLLLLPQSWTGADLTDPAARDYVATLVEEGRLSPAQVRTFASQLSQYDLTVFSHGFRPAAPSLIDALTAMFLHGGWMHLLGNMLFLWIYGDNVEHRLGRLAFVAAYVGTGLAAALGDGLLRWGSDVPSVGASGAISGVLGLYFIWFPRNRVRVWIFLFPFIANVIELPARLVLGVYIVLENLLPLFLQGGAGGVSYGAHIGGFAAGCALAPAVTMLAARAAGRVGRKRRAPEAGDSGEVAGHVRGAFDEGRHADAAHLFSGGSRRAARTGMSITDEVQLGMALERAGKPRAALAAYQRALADHASDPARAAAHLGAARILLRSLGQAAAAYQHLYAVIEEHGDSAEAAQAREMIDAMAGRA